MASFIDWSGKSTVDEQNDARRAIADASQNEEVIRALIDEVEATQRSDHSRALLVLAILGEMKSPFSIQFLQDFATRPLPQTGPVVFGEVVDETAQAILEAKAVDGLAYLGTASGDETVRQIIAQHPSKLVRAEAINAYLWNHGDSLAARRWLFAVVRPDDAILIDRVRRESGEGAASFNFKLNAFLKAHPEVAPPPPEKRPVKLPKKERPRDGG